MSCVKKYIELKQIGLLLHNLQGPVSLLPDPLRRSGQEGSPEPFKLNEIYRFACSITFHDVCVHIVVCLMLCNIWL